MVAAASGFKASMIADAPASGLHAACVRCQHQLASTLGASIPQGGRCWSRQPASWPADGVRVRRCGRCWSGCRGLRPAAAHSNSGRAPLRALLVRRARDLRVASRRCACGGHADRQQQAEPSDDPANDLPRRAAARALRCEAVGSNERRLPMGGRRNLRRRSAVRLDTTLRTGGGARSAVTDVVFEGQCDGAFVGAFPRGVWVTSSARWTLRRQVSGSTWTVEPDEVFAVGGPEGARCEVSWAARASNR